MKTYFDAVIVVVPYLVDACFEIVAMDLFGLLFIGNVFLLLSFLSPFPF